MRKSIKSILAILIASLVLVIGFALKSLIDHRHAQTFAAISAPGNSPVFSGEEAANELPDGLQWVLIDSEGDTFDWVAFCEEHPNCMEAFKAKGVPFPKIEGLTCRPEDMATYYERMATERDGEDCTTDSECTDKFGGDGGPGR